MIVYPAVYNKKENGSDDFSETGGGPYGTLADLVEVAVAMRDPIIEIHYRSGKIQEIDVMEVAQGVKFVRKHKTPEESFDQEYRGKSCDHKNNISMRLDIENKEIYSRTNQVPVEIILENYDKEIAENIKAIEYFNKQDLNATHSYSLEPMENRLARHQGILQKLLECKQDLLDNIEDYKYNAMLSLTIDAIFTVVSEFHSKYKYGRNIKPYIEFLQQIPNDILKKAIKIQKKNKDLLTWGPVNEALEDLGLI